MKRRRPQMRMGHHCRHQLLAIAAPTMGIKHEHIGQIAEGGTVGDHARERHLPYALAITAETQRAGDRPLHRVQRNAQAPIGLLAKEAMDQRQVEFLLVGTDA